MLDRVHTTNYRAVMSVFTSVIYIRHGYRTRLFARLGDYTYLVDSVVWIWGMAQPKSVLGQLQANCMILQRHIYWVAFREEKESHHVRHSDQLIFSATFIAMEKCANFEYPTPAPSNGRQALASV